MHWAGRRGARTTGTSRWHSRTTAGSWSWNPVTAGFGSSAEIQLDRENWDEAVKDFTRAEQLRPGGTKRVWTGRAKAHSKQQRWQAAVEDYRKALQADPADGSVHGQLAEAYFRLGDWKRAVEEFDQAAQELPRNLEFRKRRADALAELKDRSGAVKEYAEVAAAYRHRGSIRKRSGSTATHWT